MLDKFPTGMKACKYDTDTVEGKVMKTMRGAQTETGWKVQKNVTVGQCGGGGGAGAQPFPR